MTLFSWHQKPKGLDLNCKCVWNFDNGLGSSGNEDLGMGLGHRIGNSRDLCDLDWEVGEGLDGFNVIELSLW